ncbi:UMP kinase [Haloplasma contractile]|uniref:Uridylate kinase n=1 Tax=Haloplasma contractile SSD-17B TaxID=1033810 RepID=U2FR53_9MOLU|nr:UMP kinase [Haloplasma contractile]ERJ13469.1 Uridylate kinase protein [Haloplasma contractile SSD-17B]
MSNKHYKRIVLKLSGEAMAGDDKIGINPITVKKIAEEIKEAYETGVQISVIVGGGNIWRGKAASELGMERASADYMGMLATVMNALALQNALESCGVQTRAMTSISMQAVAEPYIRRRAVRHLEKGRIVIFGGGTGNPYFSTDTTAALRAAEVNADAILMAKNGVDGIYDSDPNLNPNAKKFDKLTFLDVVQKDLKVMDSTAATLCMENDIELILFNMNQEGNIKRAIEGQKIGTTVKGR